VDRFIAEQEALLLRDAERVVSSAGKINRFAPTPREPKRRREGRVSEEDGVPVWPQAGSI
jgi:hypothetical protein